MVFTYFYFMKSLPQVALVVKKKNPTCQCRRRSVPSLGQEDPLEEGMTTHPCVLAWESPWTEKPSSLESMVLQRVGHNLATEQQKQTAD